MTVVGQLKAIGRVSLIVFCTVTFWPLALRSQQIEAAAGLDLRGDQRAGSPMGVYAHLGIRPNWHNNLLMISLVGINRSAEVGDSVIKIPSAGLELSANLFRAKLRTFDAYATAGIGYHLFFSNTKVNGAKANSFTQEIRGTHFGVGLRRRPPTGHMGLAIEIRNFQFVGPPTRRNTWVVAGVITP